MAELSGRQASCYAISNIIWKKKSRGMVVVGWLICLVISHRNEGPGREILQRAPSVCLSVTFSFCTVTRKRIDAFSRNFTVRNDKIDDNNFKNSLCITSMKQKLSGPIEAHGPFIVSPVRSTYGGYYGLVGVPPPRPRPPPPPPPRPQTLHRSHDNLKNPYRIASIFYM